MVLKYSDTGTAVEVVDCANVQSIGGEKTFTDPMVGTGINLSNNGFGDLSQFLRLSDTSQAADEKNWGICADAASLVGYTIDDALTSTVNWLNVTRTGTAINEVQFSGGNLNVFNDLLVGGDTQTLNLQVTGLTASQAVVTDASSNLVSLGYGSTNTASTLIQRDGNGAFDAGSTTVNRPDTSSIAATYYQTATVPYWRVGMLADATNYWHLYDTDNGVEALIVNANSGSSIWSFFGSIRLTEGIFLDSAGKTLTIVEAANSCKGSGATMVAGTVTVSTTAVNTGNVVLLMKTAAGGTSTVGMPVVTIVDGTSFTITGLATDTSTWSWVIFK